MSTTTSARRTSSRAALALALLAAGARADVLHVPADFPTVADALAVALPDDEIVLAAGTYDDPITVDGFLGIKLRGQGQVVLAGGSGATPALLVANCSHVTVEHLRVAGSADLGVQVDDCSSITLSRVNVEGATDTAILLNETAAAVVDRCVVEGPGDNGILLQQSTNGSVTRCQVSGVTKVGIGLATADLCVVDRCRVTGGAQGLSLGLALGVTRCQARQCVILDATEDGIFVLGDDVILLENRVQGDSSDGIELGTGSAGGLVQDNRIVGGFFGISCMATGALLRGNRVVKPESQGFTIVGSDNSVADCRVLHSGSDAFSVFGTADGGTFTACKALHAGEDGFQVDGAHFTFTGNTSSGAEQSGFFVEGSGNLFVGNTSKGSGDIGAQSVTGNVFLDNDFGILN